MKKTISILLSLLMVFSAFSVMPFSAFAAEEYDVWVGGTRVTSDNKNNIPAAEGYEQYSGTASYDPSTETLTLNNYIYKGTGNFIRNVSTMVGGVCSQTLNTLTIILKGNNSITVTGENSNGSSYGIHVGNGYVTFKGDGTLNVESADADAARDYSETVAVAAAYGINIEGGTINALAKKGADSVGISSSNGAIYISGGRVSAVAGEATIESIGMRASNSISVGANAEYVEASGYSKAIAPYWDSMPVSTQLTGMGWTDTVGTEGWGIIAAGDYNSDDLSGCKKVVFPAVPDGQMGDNVYYKVAGKTAYVYGTGDMWDYDDTSNLSPLYGLEGVDKLVVSKGITGIGEFAFYNTSAKLAVLPDTVTTVTEGAFYNSPYLATVVTDQKLETVEYRAFYGCNSLSDIYVQGNNNLTGPDVDNSDNANDPFINAAVNYIVAGKFGDDIIILSNEAGGDDSEVVTVMVSGDKRGEKLRLTVGGDESDGDADITGYNSVLDYSSAVQDIGHITPGEHAVTASYTDSNNKEYSVSGLITFGKWFPHIEVEDVEVLFGQDAEVIIKGEDGMTGSAELTLDGNVYTVPVKDGKATITFSGISIGEYPITAEYSGDDKYLSETVTAKITVKALNTVTPETATIVYGEAAPTEVEVSYTDGYGNDIAGLPEKLPCTSSYTQYGNVGEYTISLDADKIEQQGIFDAYEQAGYGFSEFDFTATSVLTVTKAPLTITAKKQEYTYNGLYQGPGDAAYEDAQEIAELITVEGLKGTDAVTSIIVDGQGKNADTYALVPQSASVNGKTEALGNYSITYVNGVLKINPKPLNITVFGQETYARYNGKEQSYTGTVLCTNDPEFDYSKFSYTGNTTVTGTNAGDYEIMPVAANCVYSDSNYKINWSVDSPIRLTITQCALDITADNKETNHGSDLAELTYTIDNLHSCYYNEDELNISISTNADKNKPGTYEITVSCEDNPNYAVRTFNGTYTVGNSPHTWSDVTYEWTGTSSVTASRKCVYCDETESETVNTTAEQTKAPTCTEKGETTYTATFTKTAFETQIRTLDDVDALNHEYTTAVTEPTCTEQGYTTYTCIRGDDEYKDDYVDALGHKYGEEGEERYTCTVCGAVDETLKKACAEKDKAEFAASVTVTPGDDGATIAWKKAPEAKRYVIYAAYCGKNKYKKIKTVKGNITSFKLTKLSGRKINTKKNLKVYIVAQKKANGKWVKLFKTPTFHTAGKNSKYTNIKKIKVKKAEFTLEQGNTAKIKASLVLENKKKKPINHVRKFRYMSTNTAVVKVTKSGKIKAVGKGKATVYVYSNNGTAKAIKVTVK